MTLRAHVPIASLAVATISLFCAGCEATKSSNPLSPTVAGPIPGVNITAPQLVNPDAGTRIPVANQPITLTVQNATTNGVRPLTYVFEVASDANFANKVFQKNGINPGNGQTALTLPDPLATGRTYYWRAHAEDGANTGATPTAKNFDVFTPIVINAPTLVSPGPNVTVDGLRPTFTIGDASRSGPVGTIAYLAEIADSAAFTNKIASWTVGEQPGQTSFTPPLDLQYSHVYYWHVRAFDPNNNVGPFSETRAFVTPPEPVIVAPPPTPPSGPVPSGPAPNDAINLGSATIENSPSDVASWPATATITRLDLGGAGAHVDFTKKDGPGSWPDVPFGSPGDTLEYTLWIVINVNGHWYASGCIEFWRGLDRNGGPPSQYAQNWYFDPARWGPMSGHQPADGEQVGFLVTTGDARNNGNSGIRQRSNVVAVSFSNGGNVYNFSAGRTLMAPRPTAPGPTPGPPRPPIFIAPAPRAHVRPR